MAGRGLGHSMSATQKPALALWAPGSPKVHIQGNLSTGFKENRDRPERDAPPTLFTCQDWDQPPLTLAQFPSHRAGLDEGYVQICLVEGAIRFLFRLLRLS